MKQSLKPLLLLILLLSGILQYAQSSSTSLKSLYQKADAIKGRQPVEALYLIDSIKSIAYQKNWLPYFKAFSLEGTIYGEQGRYDTVFQLANAMLDTIHKYQVDSDFGKAAAYDLKGMSLEKLNRYEQALAIYDTVQMYYDRMYEGPHADKANLLQNKADVHQFQGNFERSEALYHRAINMFRELGPAYQRSILINYNNLANGFYKSQQYEKAITYYNKSYELIQKLLPPGHRHYGSILVNLGLMRMKAGQYDEAAQSYRKGLEILKQNFGPNHPHIATIWNNLGENAYQQGKYEEAILAIEKARSIYSKNFGSNHGSVAHSYSQEGIFRQAMGMDSLSIQNFKKALCANTLDCDNWQSITADTVPMDYIRYDIHQESLHRLALIYDENGQLEEAKKFWAQLNKFSDLLWQRMAERSDKLSVAGVAANYNTEAIATHYQSYRQTSGEEDLQAVYKYAESKQANLLNEVLASKEALEFSGVPDSLIQQVNQLKRKREELKAQMLQAPSDSVRQQLQTNDFTLQNRFDSLMDVVEQDFPRYYQLKHAATVTPVEKVQEDLAENETVAIEYVTTDSSIYMLVLDGENMVLKQSALPASLTEKVAAFRKSILSKSDNYYPLSWELYEWLWAPIAEDIDREKVVIVADGALGYLPFELLAPAKDSLLLQNHILHFTPSLSFWQQNQNSTHHENWTHPILAFAPTFNNGLLAGNQRQDTMRSQLTGLPGAKGEAVAVSDIFGGSALTDSMATEGQFRQHGKNAKVLHFATHGILDDRDPMLNRLYFQDEGEKEDGILHTYELYNLHLQADLAVLSACNTGYGEIRKGEGIMSMARGFQYAGVPNVVMTRWSVEDRSSKQLMENFYGYLADGLGKAEALRQAKLDYLEQTDEKGAHPFYWSGFMLVGNNNALPAEGSDWQFMAMAGIMFLMLAWFIWQRRRKASHR